ncbi:hypothetical protein STEG23_037875 [Scotinomys teguina]
MELAPLGGREVAPGSVVRQERGFSGTDSSLRTGSEATPESREKREGELGVTIVTRRPPAASPEKVLDSSLRVEWLSFPGSLMPLTVAQCCSKERQVLQLRMSSASSKERLQQQCGSPERLKRPVYLHRSYNVLASQQRFIECLVITFEEDFLSFWEY